MKHVGFIQVSQHTSFLQCVHDASQVVGRAGHAHDPRGRVVRGQHVRLPGLAFGFRPSLGWTRWCYHWPGTTVG